MNKFFPNHLGSNHKKEVIMSTPMVNGQPLSPVHWSPGNGVHADIGFGRDKVHVPFRGQTTLPTFGVGGKPSYANDKKLAELGGSYEG
jgi:hypothetical protein